MSLLDDILEILKFEHKPIYTLNEVQRILGLSRSRIARLRQAGLLQVVRSGANRVLGMRSSVIAEYLDRVNGI